MKQRTPNKRLGNGTTSVQEGAVKIGIQCSRIGRRIFSGTRPHFVSAALAAQSCTVPADSEIARANKNSALSRLDLWVVDEATSPEHNANHRGLVASSTTTNPSS